VSVEVKNLKYVNISAAVADRNGNYINNLVMQLFFHIFTRSCIDLSVSNMKICSWGASVGLVMSKGEGGNSILLNN